MLNDLRFAFRQLAKSPGFTAIALLTFALGLGATTAVFSVVHGVLLQPPDYPHPEELVQLTEFSSERPETALNGPVSLPTFLDWRKGTGSYRAMAARQNAAFTLAGETETLRLIGANVAGDFWRVFGTPPLLGSTFTPESAADVVVLSHGVWQNQFGGAADIVGRIIRLGSQSVTVLGVMPPEFEAGGAALWRPLEIRSDDLTPENRGARGLQVVGRLKPGVTRLQAQKELELIESQLVRQFPTEMRNHAATVNPFLESIIAAQRPVLLTFFAAVSGLLIIACINITNLLLVQASARAKEISLRAVLGASPGRIVRQLLIESLLLATLGGLAGVGLAWGGLKLLVASAPPGLPRLENVGLNSSVLLATAGIMGVCGVAVGLIPAIQAARMSLLDALKSGGGVIGENQRGSWMRHGLIVAETALSFVLLVNAGLLMRSFVLLTAVSPGFVPSQAVTVVVAMSGPNYRAPEQRINYVQSLTDRFRTIPGVTAVGATQAMPFSGSSLTTVARIQGREFERGDPRTPTAGYFAVTPEYFSAMGIPRIHGRAFTESDSATAPRVAIISQSFAAKYFPGVDPIGQFISMATQEAIVWREIVGVVADIRNTTLETEPPSQMYAPFAQSPSGYIGVVVRTNGPVPNLAGLLRAEVRAIDKSLPVIRVDPLEGLIAATYAKRRFASWLLTIFATVALILAANGLYGVMAFSVRQRTREFGLRAALGALPRDLLLLVFRRGAGLVSVGLLLGVTGAVGLSRFVEAQLFGTSARDPLTYAVLALFFGSIATLACWLPARRASKVDPMVALRAE